MEKSKSIALSNSLENLLFTPGRYTAAQLINLIPYFNSTFTLDKHKEVLTKIIESDQEKLWWTVKAENQTVQAKVLAIVLMLQLVGRERREFGVFNEGVKQTGHSYNQLNSPRSRTTRAMYISNEQSIILNFIKDNLKTFLRLLSNEPMNEDPVLTAAELNPISILFKTDRKKTFASNLPLFNNISKAPVSAIHDQLIGRLTINDTDIVSLEGLSFSVLIKSEEQCRGKDLRIIGCEDSEIFIDSSVASLYVVNCLNCTIYVAACERIAFMDKCEKVNLTIATNLLRICNSVDSNIYYYGASPTIMTGDNRSIQIGPNNATTSTLAEHIKKAGLPLDKEHTNYFQQVLCKDIQNTMPYSFIKPDEFNLLILPPKPDSKDNQMQLKNLLAPEAYLKGLEDRYNYFGSFKSKLVQLNLSPELVKNLHRVYQGSFKEWLISKGYTKNLNDLVKMIEKNN